MKEFADKREDVIHVGLDGSSRQKVGKVTGSSNLTAETEREGGVFSS